MALKTQRHDLLRLGPEESEWMMQGVLGVSKVPS